jgi:Zn-dependent protease with chaperone function
MTRFQVIAAVVAPMLLLPAIAAAFCWRLVLRMDDTARASAWYSIAQGFYVESLALIGAWWCFWDFWRPSIGFHGTTRSGSILVFLAVPILSTGAVRLIMAIGGAPIIKVGWGNLTLVRITAWRTVESTVALLFLALGFEAIYEGSFAFLIWFVFAAAAHLLGKGEVRRSEGWKLRPVKSGHLYKRAFQLARKHDLPIKQVCVVPVGKGHLTNAYGSRRTLAVTENYSRLGDSQLDFVICHELIHGKEGHGIKKLLITPTMVALFAVAALILPPKSLLARIVFDLLVIFLPIVVSGAVSRHFEFAADAGSVAWTGDKSAAIGALSKVYALAQTPERRSILLELFGTHPSLARRLSAIERAVDSDPLEV